MPLYEGCLLKSHGDLANGSLTQQAPSFVTKCQVTTETKFATATAKRYGELSEVLVNRQHMDRNCLQ